MDQAKSLYPSYQNPLLIEPCTLPGEVAVVGAGTIGPDIGYYLKSALPGITLYVVDIVEEPLKKAQERFSGYVAKALDKGKMKQEKADAVLENVVYTTDYERLKDCELVIEAATENIALKRKIFETIEGIVSEKTIITSNTSSIPADRIFCNMKRQERTTVTHFFAPAWRSLPVEVIRWDRVSKEVMDYLFWFFAQTGKVPLITDNAICFMLDRIFDNWCNEAAYLLESATASQIDKVAEEFVFAGPFFVLNMANGNPIIIETNSLQMEEGAHYKPAGILGSVKKWLTHHPGAKVEVPDEAVSFVRNRMLGILFSQSFDIIDRGIGTNADLNMGCQIALGFKKGPFDIMKDLGEAKVKKVMSLFENQRAGFPAAKQPVDDYQDFFRHILIDEIEGVKVITIRRPQAMNALNDEITGEILSALKLYEEDPKIKGFVITGYGNSAFSAGADIGRFPEMLGDANASIEYSRACAKVQLHMDRMKKPVVAAINGLALGGGLEVAIRCHGMTATENARFQFPEITLGIIPGIGGCIVPYRKWPEGAGLFHEMITLGKSIKVEDARQIGMVRTITEDYRSNIMAAVEEVKELEGKVEVIREGKVDIPEIVVPAEPKAGRLSLSNEAVQIAVKTIKEGAAAENFGDALEIGYRGFGEIACTDAAREGITAFLEKRKPKYTK